MDSYLKYEEASTQKLPRYYLITMCATFRNGHRTYKWYQFLYTKYTEKNGHLHGVRPTNDMITGIGSSALCLIQRRKREGTVSLCHKLISDPASGSDGGEPSIRGLLLGMAYVCHSRLLSAKMGIY